jgi:hypothetical protein
MTDHAGCSACANSTFSGGSAVGELPYSLNQNIGGYNDPTSKLTTGNLSGGKRNKKRKKRTMKTHKTSKKTKKKIRKSKKLKKR